MKNKNKNISELEAQDIVVKKFLKGELVNWKPYDVSKYQLQLINKIFLSLDTKSPIKIAWMRHGHREWQKLTEKWYQEAKENGIKHNISRCDAIFGTHQGIIESILISITWGKENRSPSDAWENLPNEWKEPYKTAQVTEFIFSTNIDWKKILTITTNNHTEEFSENDCKEAYKFISDYSAEKRI